jgi:small subunit ribosomal protein S13
MTLIYKTNKHNVNLDVPKIKFLNVHFYPNKRFIDVMRNIYGVNYFMSKAIMRMLGFSLSTKIGNISSFYLNFISDFFISYFLVERGLRKYRNNIFLQRRESGSISGYRLFKGLPVNGQRTHTNARTVRSMFKLYNFNDF